LSVTLALLLVAAPDSGPVPPEPQSQSVEDVVVTADRSGFGAELVQVGTFRGARVIDVPLTVNVVPSELLRAQAAQSLFDALRNTAGVSRAQLNGATYDNVAIRGILVENRTSYRLNGMLPVINLVDLPLENKDRVEVLKGVGALYYGFAPPSGIVNLVTKRADRDVTEATLQLNEYAGSSAAIDVGRRFAGDRAGLRFNGSAGIVETGIGRFSGERFVAALAGDLALSDRLKLFVDVEHVAKDVTEPAALQLLPAAQGRVPAIPDPRTNFGGENLRYAASATNWLGRADWRLLDRLVLTVEYGEARTERDRDFSQLESYGGATGQGVLRIFRTRDQRYRNRNARAEIAAAFTTGPIAHNLVAGVTSNWRFQNGRNGAAITLPQSFVAPRDVPADEPTVFTAAPLNIRDLGYYVTDRLSLGPVDVLAGLRRSDYRNRATSAAGVITRFALDEWTPSVGLIVKPVDRLSVYATYIEGLEEGGTAPSNTANAFEVLPPAVTRQYEAGIKGEALRGVVFQLAGFRIERRFAFTDLADNVFKLAGDTRYQGIEASVTGEVTSRLSIYASGQYLDAEIRRSNQAALIGRTPENTPEWTGSLFAEYRPVERLGLGAGAFHVGERAVDAANTASVDGYTLFSASARYTFAGRTPFTLQLNADNLFDTRYWSAAGNNLLGVGLPRQVKLTARIGL
jgi:iron complex outermembrane receptor protein